MLWHRAVVALSSSRQQLLMTTAGRLTFVVVAAALALGNKATYARMTIACAPYVDPCHCGLCPHIVDCRVQRSAECFCGRAAAPGTYAHPTDQTKFWMCSRDDSRGISYGVEMNCPGRLVFCAKARVCTLPSQALLGGPSQTRSDTSGTANKQNANFTGLPPVNNSMNAARPSQSGIVVAAIPRPVGSLVPR